MLAALLLPGFAGATTPADASAYNETGFHAGAAALNPSERAGREIWYKATAGNARFHTYVFQQRLGVLIDWWRVLRSDRRLERFRIWGLINDPGCCRPGSPGCPATTLEVTYGLDWCHGDDQLLAYVGHDGYRDPACDFEDSPVLRGHPHGPQDQREDPCHLAFGTSAGAMGLRKFPNPRFDPGRWRELNGGRLGTWAGYARAAPDGTRRLADASVEPPFLIGIACGACHVGFNPADPPPDPAHPKWENLLGAVGNQYSRLAKVMVSGMPPHSLEWQVFSHARPGTMDTSAVPTDQINNPGSINAIINLRRRPRFVEDVERWRATSSCPAKADVGRCWCEPGRQGKCWRKSLQTERVFHVLKNSEDSTGDMLAVQRVYINIGACAEVCWVNHLTNLQQFDPRQRNYGQTEVDTAQCRRDCPAFRAIEDRALDVVNFLLSSETNATPLWKAKGLASQDDWVDRLEQTYGEGAVARGRTLFAQHCASCHSSQSDLPEKRDFARVDPVTGLRADWLGNDRPTPASQVGTYPCRALHSNHLAGHVWGEFASDTYHARAPDPGLADATGGGTGYMRNISLLDLWAHAPFMHNNAVGPELCGKPSVPADEFYRSPYVDAEGSPLPEPPPCWAYDPSVQGRYELFLASVEALLHPDERVPKITLTDRPMRRRLGPKLWDDGDQRLVGLELELPAGTPVALYGSLQHKALLRDLALAATDRTALQRRLAQRLGGQGVTAATAQLESIASAALANPAAVVPAARASLPLLSRLYSSCRARVENAGHRFGAGLSPQDKRALTAFLATL